MSSGRRPRIGFVGPHLGKHPGWVTTQSEVLSELFTRAGHDVETTSSIRSPALRLIDTLRALYHWRGRVDVAVISVFSGRAFLLGDLASRVAKFLGLPQIHWLHGGDLPEMVDRHPERVRSLFDRAVAVVAPSPYLSRMAEQLHPKVEVIPNVLDPTAYEFRQRSSIRRPIRILWMRTFHPLYRPELALEALVHLRQTFPEAQLTLAGQDKGLLEACRSRAADLGLAEAVDFPGFLDGAGKQRAFAEHDIFWNTNAIDNTPVTVLEAMASGLPVVAIAAGGLADLLRQGSLGVLVPDDAERDLPQALATATEALIKDPARAADLSQKAHQATLASAWGPVYRHWLDLLASNGIPSTNLAAGAGPDDAAI